MHIFWLIKLNFIPDTETKKYLLLNREQKHVVQHIHPVGNNMNSQSRDTHKVLRNKSFTELILGTVWNKEYPANK